MNRIDEAFDNLLEAVKQSEEYERYQIIQEQINEYPELEREINGFRQKVYLLQNSNGTIDIYDETDRMEEEYREFRKTPLVSEYLAAECALCRMIQQINWRMIEGLNFDAGLENE